MKKTGVIAARTAVLAAAAVMIAAGIFRGEVGIILHKAAMICFECIGIG